MGTWTKKDVGWTRVVDGTRQNITDEQYAEIVKVKPKGKGK